MNNSKIKKKNPRKKYRSLRYKPSVSKVSTFGLGFPDNFMAILGYKRLK